MTHSIVCTGVDLLTSAGDMRRLLAPLIRMLASASWCSKIGSLLSHDKSILAKSASLPAELHETADAVAFAVQDIAEPSRRLKRQLEQTSQSFECALLLWPASLAQASVAWQCLWAAL